MSAHKLSFFKYEILIFVSKENKYISIKMKM